MDITGATMTHGKRNWYPIIMEIYTMKNTWTKMMLVASGGLLLANGCNISGLLGIDAAVSGLTTQLNSLLGTLNLGNLTSLLGN